MLQESVYFSAMFTVAAEDFTVNCDRDYEL